MIKYLKKLTFALFLLVAFAFLCHKLSYLFNTYDFIFSLSSQVYIDMINISILISLFSFLFILFSTLAMELKLIIPIGVALFILAIIFFGYQLSGLVFAIGILVILFIIYISVENVMKNYLNFSPASIFSPIVKYLSGLLIFVIAVSYYFSINNVLMKNGFQIPDSIIETVIELSPNINQLIKQSNDSQSLLKINSESQQNFIRDSIKKTIRGQIQDIIKPFIGFVPIILALLFFITFQSITSLVNLLIYSLFWLTFFVLEKIGFITFIEEQRTVRKIVI